MGKVIHDACFAKSLKGGYTSNFRFRVLLYFVDHYALISYPNCPKSVLNKTSVYFQGFCKFYIFQFSTFPGNPPVEKKFSIFFLKKKLGFIDFYKFAKSQYFFKIAKGCPRTVRASTKLSNRILIFGPKNFWCAYKCNQAARFDSNAPKMFRAQNRNTVG